jgi:hypothetical protein
MHNAQCTMHNAQCPMHNAQCTMSRVLFMTHFSLCHSFLRSVLSPVLRTVHRPLADPEREARLYTYPFEIRFSHVENVLFWVFCSGCSGRGVLFGVFCSGCSGRGVLVGVFCSGCSVLVCSGRGVLWTTSIKQLHKCIS